MRCEATEEPPSSSLTKHLTGFHLLSQAFQREPPVQTQSGGFFSPKREIFHKKQRAETFLDSLSGEGLHRSLSEA